jgi:peptidoglycan/LPS O-acetylase OafA/YrhL
VPEIDALRAVAVLAVMAYHLNARWLPGGYAGVDVFFVISGYVISKSISDLHDAGFAAYATRFYARRLLRIVPALVVCLFVTSVVTTLFVPNSWLSFASDTVLKFAFLGLSNYALLRSNDSYFAPRAEYNAYTHTWSLGVEEQFYLLFPLLFYLYLRNRGKGAAAGWVTSATLPVMCLASLAYCAYATTHAPSDAYYTLPSRFWELASGALLFQLHSARPNWRDRWSSRDRRLAVAGSMVLVALSFTLALPGRFPFPVAMATVVGTLGLIDAFVTVSARSSALTRPFRSRALIWIGERSYSLYLWHWPVYVLLRWTVGVESWATSVIAVALTVALSVVSFEWVESPFRRIRATSGVGRGALVTAMVVLLLAAGKLSMAVVRSQSTLSRSVTARDRSAWYPDSIARGDSGGRHCAIQHSSHTLRTGDLVRVFRASACAEERPANRIFVIGNSHALAYTPLLQALVQTGRYEVHMYFRPGCTFLPLMRRMAEEPRDCWDFHAATVRDVTGALERGNVVFLPSLRLPRLTDQWSAASEKDARTQMFGAAAIEQRDLATREARTILAPIARMGVPIVFEAPKPIFRAPAFRCSDWFNRSNPICAGGLNIDRTEMLEYRRPLLDAMWALSRDLPHVSVWDPFDLLCPTRNCSAVVAGGPLFFDGDHLSGYANEILYSSFDRHLRANAGLALSSGTNGRLGRAAGELAFTLDPTASEAVTRSSRPVAGIRPATKLRP